MSDAENQELTSNVGDLLDRSFDTDKSNIDEVDSLVREGSPDSLNVDGKRTPPDIPRTIKSRSSYKSKKSSGGSRTSANSGRPKTRARQIKPHEVGRLCHALRQSRRRKLIYINFHYDHAENISIYNY